MSVIQTAHAASPQTPRWKYHPCRTGCRLFAAVDPVTVLSVGLKVDSEALPAALISGVMKLEELIEIAEAAAWCMVC